MIPLLGPGDPFPPVERAMDDPNGLLAAGGGLGVARLVEAYSHGIFPWFSEGDPVLWWCPDPRMVLATDAVHVSRSLQRRLRRHDYQITMDRAFAEVLRDCAAPRRDHAETWLVPSMMRAYQRLHDAGVAHSLEVWIDGSLAGGIYGVAIGRMFFGESMFSRQTNGSKMALVALAAQLTRWAFPLIDCQMQTAHLVTMGAREMARAKFVPLVTRLVQRTSMRAPWTVDEDLIAQFH